MLPNIQIKDTERQEITGFLHATADNSLSYNEEAIDKIIVSFLTSSDILKVRLSAILETLVARHKVTLMSSILQDVLNSQQQHIQRLNVLCDQIGGLTARLEKVQADSIKAELEKVQSEIVKIQQDSQEKKRYLEPVLA